MQIVNTNKYDYRSYPNEDINSFINRISFDNEKWDYYDKYNLVSTKGRIIGCPSKNSSFYRIKKQFIKSNGYCIVPINNKKEYVHRIVAKTFIPNPNNFKQVNHKNEIKSDNRIENLEWCSAEYNVAYSLSRKIKQIDIATKQVINIFDSANQAAKYINGTNVNILAVCDRKTGYNTMYGYIWRYIDDNDYNIKNKCKKTIYQVDKSTYKIINKFNSVIEAAKFIGVDASSISDVLRGKGKTCKGYIWLYDPFS
jgi:hypothetical protein